MDHRQQSLQGVSKISGARMSPQKLIVAWRRRVAAALTHRQPACRDVPGEWHGEKSKMKRWAVAFLIAGVAFAPTADAQDRLAGKRMEAVRGIIAAVNARDADAYVANFTEDAIVRLYEGEVRVRGRQAMRENRMRHFERYPHVHNELRYVAAIDDRVIMHDRVWLDRRVSQPADVVEVFTFDADDRIVRVDVIQPRDVHTRRAPPAQN
jgi:hypothetical protein